MTSGRAQGLDTLRALAIALVFAYHYRVFVSDAPSLGWFSAVGWIGVDLFFVLSGYLIANQVLAGTVIGRPLSLRSFYLRRALRTWPAFWFMLAAYTLFRPQLGGKEPPPLWAFLSFTQNIGLQPGTAFSHAWSLCIEEQFYLVFPLVVLLATRIGSRRSHAWWLLGASMLAGIALRALLWTRYGGEESGSADGYYPHIYYATLCRADEFLPGIAVALLKNRHPQLWLRITEHGHALLLGGLMAIGALVWALLRTYYVDGVGYGFFMTAFGYSLVAAAFAVLVVAALSPSSWLYRCHVPGAQQLALWSYSIYLSHKAVAHVLRATTKTLGWPAWGLWAVVLAASLLVGALLYRFVESPFMRLRQRWAPSVFAPEPGRQQGHTMC